MGTGDDSCSGRNGRRPGETTLTIAGSLPVYKVVTYTMEDVRRAQNDEVVGRWGIKIGGDKEEGSVGVQLCMHVNTMLLLGTSVALITCSSNSLSTKQLHGATLSLLSVLNICVRKWRP